MNAVITGASRGIGFAIAEIFAQHGYTILLTAKNEEKLYNAVAALQAAYPAARIHAKAFDLATKETALACGHWCLTYGTPTVLVNNAGSFIPGSISSEAVDVLEHQIATNLYSAYHLTRTLLPAMQQAATGHIFNLCSIASLKAYANGGAYSISKFALYGFSKNLREELQPQGIKVTAVLPGAVMTDSWSGFDNSEQRIMEARDIAIMIHAATLLSPAACVEDIVIRPQLGDL